MSTSFSDPPRFPNRLGTDQATPESREAALLAPYAMFSGQSRGRKHPEPLHPYRSPYARDRDRVVHSAAFRRLSSKTQVFTGDMGDYHRTRLTHTLEVASIARTIARALRLNEDLVESLAVAHDLGHPPFGHAGEDTLDECLAGQGGFNHNRQALRIVELLESRYRQFAGLNLTFEVLEGQQSRADKESRKSDPLLEVQLVDAADSVAYDTHDADDALELGLLDLAELLELPLWREAASRLRRRFTDLREAELRRAVLHELIDWQVSDILAATTGRIAAKQIDGVVAVRSAGTVVAPSAALTEQKSELEDFLFERVYRHQSVLEVRRRAQHALVEMFAGYVKDPGRLPGKFRDRCEQDGVERSVGDYLAGMTDRFALQEHERLFS